MWISLRAGTCLCVLAILAHSSLAQEPDFSKELPRVAPVEPDAALDTFQVLPGYRLELVAAEPLVASPVAVCWDERGRMYAVEMRGYSEHRDEGLSRIRLVFDDDNDGRYDRSIVFADKLLWPTAIHPWDDGVFVADAPDILYLKDTNDDGVADVRRRVFTGFGTQNVQGLLNSFHWHFDNRIHGSASSNGGEITVVDKPDLQPVPVRGRDFSFDPRTQDFRAESGGAQHGMCFDDFGSKFVCSNSDHAQHVMFEDRYLARNPHVAAPSARVSIAADGPQAEVFRISPVEPWRVVRTRLRVSGSVPGPIEGGGRAAGYFTGATGVTVVRGSAFAGDEMEGMLVVGDVGSNLVHRKRLVLKGVQYEAQRVDEQSELLASKDNWFRPAQFANGPDAALTIIDVYREVIEHPASLPPVIKKHLDLDSGRDRGRIYRLSPRNWKRSQFQRLDDRPIADLVKLLDHPNAWHRETASRLIYERQANEAAESMVRLARSKDSTPQGRIHALYALAGQQLLDAADVKHALSDSDARVREHAMRLAEHFPDDPAIAAQLVFANESDPQARLQLAFTLGAFPSGPKHREALFRLAASGDRWLQLAFSASLGSNTFDALMALVKQQVEQFESARQPLVRQLAVQFGRSRDPRIATLCNSLRDLPDELSLLRIDVLLSLQEGARARGPAFSALFPKADKALINNLSARAFADALQIVDDQARSHTDRIAALRGLSLGSVAEAQEPLDRFLHSSEPDFQRTALRVYSEFDDPRAGDSVLAAWPKFGPELRRAAVEVLISRPELVKRLLTAIQDREIAPTEIDRTHIELLKKHADPAIRTQAEKLFGANARRADVVEAYRSVLEMQGSAVKGKELFAKNCAVCHRLENAGHEIGPNLAAMKNRGPESILLNVLDPNREVNPQYLGYVVATHDGRTLTGMITAESAASITLKRADGQGEEVLRSDIEELKNTGLSLMPEGLERQLDQHALADVIAYVMSVK